MDVLDMGGEQFDEDQLVVIEHDELMMEDNDGELMGDVEENECGDTVTLAPVDIAPTSSIHAQPSSVIVQSGSDQSDSLLSDGFGPTLAELVSGQFRNRRLHQGITRQNRLDVDEDEEAEMAQAQSVSTICSSQPVTSQTLMSTSGAVSVSGLSATNGTAVLRALSTVASGASGADAGYVLVPVVFLQTGDGSTTLVPVSNIGQTNFSTDALRLGTAVSNSGGLSSLMGATQFSTSLSSVSSSAMTLFSATTTGTSTTPSTGSAIPITLNSILQHVQHSSQSTPTSQILVNCPSERQHLSVSLAPSRIGSSGASLSRSKRVGANASLSFRIDPSAVVVEEEVEDDDLEETDQPSQSLRSRDSLGIDTGDSDTRPSTNQSNLSTHSNTTQRATLDTSIQTNSSVEEAQVVSETEDDSCGPDSVLVANPIISDDQLPLLPSDEIVNEINIAANRVDSPCPEEIEEDDVGVVDSLVVDEQVRTTVASDQTTSSALVTGDTDDMIDASDFRSVLGDPSGHHHPHHPYHPAHHGHHAVAHHAHHPGAHHPSHHPQLHHQGLNGRMTPPGFAVAAQQGSYATLTPLQPLPPISTMSDKFTHHPYGHQIPHHQAAAAAAHHQQLQAAAAAAANASGHAALMAHHMHQSAAMSMNLDQSGSMHHPDQNHPSNQYAQHLQRNVGLNPHSQSQVQHYDSAKQLASMVSLSSPMSCMASPPNSASSQTSRHVSAAVAALINGGPQSVITSVSSASNRNNSNQNGNSDLLGGLQSPDRSLGSPCSGYDYSTNSLVRDMSSAMASPPTSPSTARSVINLHSPSNPFSSAMNGSVLDSITTTMAGNGNNRASSNDSCNNSPARHLNCSPSPPPGQLTSLTHHNQHLSNQQHHNQLSQHLSQHQSAPNHHHHHHQQQQVLTINALNAAHLLAKQNAAAAAAAAASLSVHHPQHLLIGSANGQLLGGATSSGPTVINHHHPGPPPSAGSIGSAGSVDSSTSGDDQEELNTKDLAQRISAELKRYSIPQAIFAQRVLCRSQGTLSDLLRNPKPWSKLKSGRETFRRMQKWLEEPEFQRMSALRLAACKRKEEQQQTIVPCNGGGGGNGGGQQISIGNQSGMGQLSGLVGTLGNGLGNGTSVLVPTCGPQIITGPLSSGSSVSSVSAMSSGGNLNGGGGGGGGGHGKSVAPKKPRLVFTDLQRRTLQAIFKETKRPSKEMQITISQQLGLELSTVGNFFMNARRRSQDKWMEDPPGSGHHRGEDNSSGSSATSKSSKAHHKSSNNGVGGATSLPTSVLTMGSNVIVSCT